MLGAHTICVCIWPRKGVSCSTWPAAAWCDKIFSVKVRIWPWGPSDWGSRTQNIPFGPSALCRNQMPVQAARLSPGWNGAKKLFVQSVWNVDELQRDPHRMSLWIQTWWLQQGAKGRPLNCGETEGYFRNLRSQLWGWGGEKSKIGIDMVKMNSAVHNIVKS